MCIVWTARPPAALMRGAHAPSTGEGAGHIRGCEECAQCDGTHEYILPAHMQRWGLSHALDCCHLTACSDTQCNICTHRLQLHVCVGCNVRLTVNKQTNNHITLTCDSYTENAQEMQALSGPHTQHSHGVWLGIVRERD